VVEILLLFFWWWLIKKERDDKKKDEDQSCGMIDKGRDGERERGRRKNSSSSHNKDNEYDDMINLKKE